jgi:hypothetical protein
MWYQSPERLKAPERDTEGPVTPELIKQSGIGKFQNVFTEIAV